MSWPEVELVIDERHAVIRGRRFNLFSEVLVERDAVVGITLRRGFMSTGVQFETPDGSLDRVTFWARRRQQLLEPLRKFGWPSPRPARRRSAH